MSFIGSIDSLMAESGLYELLDSTFAGVQKTMTVKKFLKNMRALRIAADELSWDRLCDKSCFHHDDVYPH